MLPLLLGALAGLGVGGIKSIIQGDQEASDRRLAADTAKYAPWTGLIGKDPGHTDTFGNMFSGTVGGAMQGQNVGNYLKSLPEDAPAIAGQVSKSGVPNLGMGQLPKPQSWQDLTHGAAGPAPQASIQQLQKVVPGYDPGQIGLGIGQYKQPSWQDLMQSQAQTQPAQRAMQRPMPYSSSFGAWPG